MGQRQCNHYNHWLRRRLAHNGTRKADMNAAESVFLELSPPGAAACCYVAAVLAVAIFFKFNRLLSVRNLDVLTLFAVMPGLLVLIESKGSNWWGYLWLFCGSGYFLVRCLFDLVLV